MNNLYEGDSKEASFAKLVRQLLIDQAKITPENTMSSREIWDKRGPQFEELGITRPNLSNWLTWLKEHPDSGVVCLGTRQGYFYKSIIAVGSEEPPIISDITAKQNELSIRINIQREQILYDKFSNWLRRRGYRAKVTAPVKRNGRWGNPDIVGITSVDLFESSNVEIATIEAKTSTAEWEYWIFEAVSHRRFANRAYFAFAAEVESDLNSSTLNYMRYYAELYKIGILMLLLPANLLEKLNNASSLSAKEFEDIENVVEVCAAPYCLVRATYQKDFLKNIDIRERKDLYNWGNDRIG